MTTDTSADAVNHAEILRRLAGGGDGYFAQSDIARLYAAADLIAALSADLEAMRAERDAAIARAEQAEVEGDALQARVAELEGALNRIGKTYPADQSRLIHSEAQIAEMVRAALSQEGRE